MLRLSSETLEALAAFEAEREDLEDDGSDEPTAEDGLFDEVEVHADDDRGLDGS